ncbi:Cof-type HAD-IIB family hydrolase [Oscillochloris sp. ZM17-4]|uniref:Cof-type HAD-IIB family hydrolase n=1 Tax=Oscillochloris sp. ZM17-4 TaxID=2866714 RepID=UPI001C73310E|nr:Cof-type HAD-IIB family hydrolase [Oscillochloris sp. ZM17-4]MBX0328654.1 Cof-type HAD-IIB family hydrolase [Oscillochloris sp. ZM17-4]
MPFRLIAIDLDGTLLDPQHRISPANAAAVAAAVAGGARVLIATGRMFASARPYARALGLRGPQITLNGAILADPDGDRLHIRARLSPEQLAAAVDLMDAREMPYVVFGPNVIYALPGMPHVQILEDYGEPPAVRLAREALLRVPDPNKVLTFLGPGPLDAELIALMGDRFEVMRTSPHFFEFLPPGINKGSALAELMARYEVPREEVLAIGDGENDISMFGVAGMSVAMEGAPAAVKAHADALTAHCADDGVALALQRYVLS